MFILSLGICAFGLWVTLLGGRRGQYTHALGVQPALLLLACVGGLPILLMPVLVVPLCFVAIERKLPFRTFSGWATCLTIAALILGSIPAGTEVAERIALRDDYPFEEISHRLADQATFAAPSPVLEQSTLKHLNAVETQMDRNAREGERQARSIKRLHQDAVTQFVGAPGFGFSRMPIFSTPRTQPDPGPIALPTTPYVPDTDILIGASPIDISPPSQAELTTMHQAGVVDFVNQFGFGFQNPQGQVAGFESHRFREMPGFSRTATSNHWLLVRLQLIGILESETPRVYESAHLPRMDQLADARTRPLNPFESEALGKLYDGEDLLTRDAADHILAVGSLRATKQCLDCHSVDRGTLLGAFSYEFRPLRPRAESVGDGA